MDLKIKTFLDDFKLWDESRLKEISDKVRQLFMQRVPNYIAEVKKERKLWKKLKFTVNL